MRKVRLWFFVVLLCFDLLNHLFKFSLGNNRDA